MREAELRSYVAETRTRMEEMLYFARKDLEEAQTRVRALKGTIQRNAEFVKKLTANKEPNQ